MQEQFAKRRWRNGAIILLFVLVACENLFRSQRRLSFVSSPFFEVFSTDHYSIARKFDIFTDSQQSISIDLNDLLHRVYDVNLILGTIVWHVFKADMLNNSKNIDFYLNALFCDEVLRNALVKTGPIRSVTYSNSKGVQIERRCR